MINTPLSIESIRELDRSAIQDYGIPSMVLMERAALSVTQVALDVAEALNIKVAQIFCGKGNNAGDGYAIARMLKHVDMEVQIFALSDPTELQGDALANYNIIKRLEIPVLEIESFSPSDNTIVIDALLGTGLKGEVSEPFASAIKLINATENPIISVDIPSGLDGDTGQIAGACVQADITVTFAATKKGFQLNQGPTCCGEITLSDIGIPEQCYEKITEQ